MQRLTEPWVRAQELLGSGNLSFFFNVLSVHLLLAAPALAKELMALARELMALAAELMALMRVGW